MKLNPAHALLEIHLKELGLEFDREVKFSLDRRWRFDYVLENNIAIEIEGSVYAQGRHTRGKGFEADCEKYNTATTMGWRVLRFSTGQILRGEARDFLKKWREHEQRPLYGQGGSNDR